MAPSASPTPKSGRQLFIALRETREAIEAAEPMFEQMGDEIPEGVRGRRVSKEYSEVVLGSSSSPSPSLC